MYGRGVEEYWKGRKEQAKTKKKKLRTDSRSVFVDEDAADGGKQDSQKKSKVLQR